MKDRRILIVDDEPHMRRVLEIMLRQMGCDTVAAVNGREALEAFGADAVDLVITDLRMPEMDGLELLAALRAQGSDVPVIVITAHGTIETAIQAIKQGAVDYLLRPFDIEVLELAVKRIFNGADVVRDNTFLRQELDRGWDTFVGMSGPMRDVYAQIQQVGPSKASVLITGETGTGKELAARAVHDASSRRKRLFVPINCAALPSEMLESELFGFERGAFTGATKDRVGKFEFADGGTIFLDELTEMPIALQAKLLRVLQDGAVERLGSNRVKHLDIRVIAATNRDPRDAVRDNKLREDLYYRLNVFSIALPPLRDRSEDIGRLVDHFIAKHGDVSRKSRLSESALSRLQAYPWPGNVRELENMVERALIVSGGGILSDRHFLLDSHATVPEAAASRTVRADTDDARRSLTEAVEELETQMIDAALARFNGNKAKAAAWLDISERTLWYKLKKGRQPPVAPAVSDG